MVQRPVGGLFGGWSTSHLTSDRVEDFLPTGEGLFAFTTVAEAVAAIGAVRADYRLHSAAARQIALEHFDSDKILRRLLADL